MTGAWAAAADALGGALGGSGDVVFVQAEAVVALEAVASGVAAPGVRALNVITGPYGAGMGAWLRRGGAGVRDLEFPAGTPADPDAVVKALGDGVDVVSIVHGEAATGVRNPLDEIAAAVRDAGALLVVVWKND